MNILYTEQITGYYKPIALLPISIGTLLLITVSIYLIYEKKKIYIGPTIIITVLILFIVSLYYFLREVPIGNRYYALPDSNQSVEEYMDKYSNVVQMGDILIIEDYT